MITRAVAVAAVGCLTVGGLGACSSSDTKNANVVTSTKTACNVGKLQYDAGKTTFKVQNKGSEATELYVYAPGDKIVGEVENVGPGTSRTLTVNLAKGSYELACKPGMTGAGIRQAITVVGEGGAAEKAADRAVEVKAVDFSFQLPTGFSAKKGETIEFELENAGQQKHEFEVLGPDGDNVGEVGETAPGAKGDAKITFAEAGTYRYKCGIDDHEQRGMTGSFTLS